MLPKAIIILMLGVFSFPVLSRYTLSGDFARYRVPGLPLLVIIALYARQVMVLHMPGTRIVKMFRLALYYMLFFAGITYLSSKVLPWSIVSPQFILFLVVMFGSSFLVVVISLKGSRSQNLRSLSGR